MNQPLDKLLADIEADVVSATPEVVLLALNILAEAGTRAVKELKLCRSSRQLLEKYKQILRSYSTFKILWHRFRRRCDENIWSHQCDFRSDGGHIARQIRKYKGELMDAFRIVQGAIPEITYRDMNRLSLNDLFEKYLGKTTGPIEYPASGTKFNLKWLECNVAQLYSTPKVNPRAVLEL